MTSAVSLDVPPPADASAHLDVFTRVFALDLNPPRAPGSKKLVELQDAGFRLGRRYRETLKTRGHNAFDPREEFRELYNWRIANLGAAVTIDIVTSDEPVTGAEMADRIVRAKKYPAFYTDWLWTLTNHPRLLRRHGSIVALGSRIASSTDPEYHGELIDHVPYAVFEPLLGLAGVLSTCETVTPFPPGTGFLTVDLG